MRLMIPLLLVMSSLAAPAPVSAALGVGLADAPVSSRARDASRPVQRDAAALLALHAEVMQAHRAGEVEVLLRAEGDDYVVVSRGSVSNPDRAARRARLGPYLASTRFTVYEDLRPPQVRVSADGTLGWVVVEVHAVGEQTGTDGVVRPLEFQSAWVELYARVDGVWRRVGNVSNFRP